MTGQFDLYGVFLPSFAALALFAYGVFRVLASFLDKIGLYQFVWHRALFNLALYVTLLSGFSVATNWFQR
jgi:EamA domain-containing membrane protein RarD